MAANSRYECPYQAPAAGTAGRAGHNPSWAPAKPWAVAETSRSEHSHLESPAIRAPIPSRMAATARCEHSLREPAATRRSPGITSDHPICANARMGLAAGWGSPCETAHIGLPLPGVESRCKQPPKGFKERGCCRARRARLRPTPCPQPRAPADGPRRSAPRRKNASRV